MATKEATPTMPSAYKTVGEVVAALNERISDDDIKQVQGSGGKSYGYVPWDRSMNILTDIFGPFGWSEHIIDRHSDTTQGIYSCAVEITGYAVDDSTGQVVSFTRPGVGRSLAQPTSSGKLLHDTAIAAAESDALSRAAKKFGPALGSILYDKDDPARTANTAATTNYKLPTAQVGAPTGGDLGFRPSAAQRNVLVKYRGLTEAQIDAMPFQQWKDIMDQKVSASAARAVPPTYANAASGAYSAANTAVAEDDFPF